MYKPSLKMPSKASGKLPKRFGEMKHNFLFKISIIYTIIAAFVMVITLLCIDYYEIGTHYSNYVFYSVGGSILLTSLITSVSGWNVHSTNERTLLIALHLAMVFIGICIVVDQFNPIFGVIGYSSMYLLIAVYWISAMYFFGIVGTKYASQKRLEEIKDKHADKGDKKMKRWSRRVAKNG